MINDIQGNPNEEILFLSKDLSERLANKKLSVELMIFIHSFFIFLGPRGFFDKRGQKGFNKPD